MNLSDLLSSNISPADDNNGPIPSGTYEMAATKGEEFTSRTGTDGYRITWKVRGGEYDGRRVWENLWFTPAAIAYTKRDLFKLGITKDNPTIPDGIICRVQVVLRQNDNGYQFNEVKRFDFLRMETDPFAPSNEPATPEAIRKQTLSTSKPEQPEVGTISKQTLTPEDVQWRLNRADLTPEQSKVLHCSWANPPDYLLAKLVVSRQEWNNYILESNTLAASHDFLADLREGK